MSLEDRLTGLAEAVGADVKDLHDEIDALPVIFVQETAPVNPPVNSLWIW